MEARLKKQEMQVRKEGEPVEMQAWLGINRNVYILYIYIYSDNIFMQNHFVHK